LMKKDIVFFQPMVMAVVGGRFDLFVLSFRVDYAFGTGQLEFGPYVGVAF